jgi:hypothetical protein
VFLLQEVEDWYLEFCGREPGLADKVTEAIKALVAEGPTLVDHIKGSRLHNLRNSDRRGAPPTSGSCSSSSETPGGASGGRRQGREREGLVRHEDPDRRVSLRPVGSSNRRTNEREKPTARPWSAVKRDAVASGAMTQEHLEADKRRTIAEVRAHRLAEIRKESPRPRASPQRSCTSARAGSRGSSPADWPIPNSERSVVRRGARGFLTHRRGLR